MLAYFKMKRICREYAQQNLRDAEDWFAKYDAGKPHAFSREFQIKLNTAIYGEAFTDAEINDYLHPVWYADRLRRLTVGRSGSNGLACAMQLQSLPLPY